MGQKKKTGEKQPKETDKIKKKLERVATLKPMTSTNRGSISMRNDACPTLSAAIRVVPKSPGDQKEV